MQAKLDTRNNTLEFAVNGNAQHTKLTTKASHIYLSNIRIHTSADGPENTQHYLPCTNHDDDDLIDSLHYNTTPGENRPITNSALRQLHINTQNCKKEDLIRYLKRLNQWHPSLSVAIDDLLAECACKDAESR